MGAGVQGISTNEALKRGKELEEAIKIGKTDQAVEIGTEMISGGLNIFGKGALDDLSEAGIKKIKNDLLRFMVRQGYNVTMENVEEYISGAWEKISEAGNYEPDKKTMDILKDYVKDIPETTKATIISTVLLNTLTGGLVGDISTLNNDVKITDTINESNLTDFQKETLKKVAVENEMSIEEVQQAIQNTLDGKYAQAEQNQAPTTQNDESLQQEQQTISNEQKKAQNVTSEQIEENAPKEENLKSSIEKLQLKEDYKTKLSDEMIDNMQQVFDKRNVKARFEDIFDDDSEGARWIKRTDENGNVTREVILNPNASEDTILQEMEIHELMHDIVSGSKDGLKNWQNVLDYLEEDPEYSKLWDSLADKYSEYYNINDADFTDKVNEEVLAKVMQTKFGSQEEINRLVKYKPSVARNIYDKVVAKVNELFQKYKGDNKLLNKAKDYIFWKNVQNNFEKAYAENQEFGNKNENRQASDSKRVLPNGAEQTSIQAFNETETTGQMSIDNMNQENIEENQEEQLQIEEQPQEEVKEEKQEEIKEETKQEKTEEKPKETKQEQPKEKVERKPKADKIEDFGEKIGLARKDLATERVTRQIKKEVSHEYEVVSAEEYNEKMKRAFIIFGNEKQQIEGYGVTFKGKLLTDGFKTPEQAEQFIQTFKDNLKSNMAYVEEAQKRDGTPIYTINIRNPRNPTHSERTTKSFDNKADAEAYAIALSVYLKEHGKNLFRPQIQSVERVNPNNKNVTKATGEDILNNFNFRGGEFGNWVTNSERQEFLNYGQNAFYDLAEALDIDPKSLGEDGKMAIAFRSKRKRTNWSSCSL